MTIELTADEASMIRYALNEMGNRRREQEINRNSTDHTESEKHYDLAKRFSNWEGVPKP